MTTTPVGSADLGVELDGPVVRLTLRRPEKRNALSQRLLADLDRALDAVAADTSARVVVLTGAGPVFCAGHDLAEMVGHDEMAYRDLFTLCSRVMQKLRRLPQPTIARVQGPATAAGCQLVAACDLAVAVDSATFATPGVRIGLFCTTPMVPLVRTVAPRQAMEMLLTGRPVPAAEALAWGLVNRVVPADRLDEAVAEMVAPIVASSPLTVRLGKQAFYATLPLDEAAAYAAATEVMTDNALRHDAQEGMAAFLQKRAPRWTGA
ncbi:MAG: enoyl-CoA hydratase [Gemmataceae bacterium]